MVSRLSKDFYGLIRVCGLFVALRWALFVMLNCFAILKSGNLQAADVAMGEGPFQVTLKRYRCRFKIRGERCISAVREMYVRDIYLGNGWLNVKPGGTVLDLGANMGNFTNLALAIDSTARVVAVEPGIHLNGMFNRSVGLNAGHAERTTLIRGILGDPCDKLTGDENYSGVERITEEQLIERASISTIDFIKCDIEGGEFALLTRDSKLLGMARAIACELHSQSGNMDDFLAIIKAAGFTIGPTHHARDGGSLVFLAKRGD